MKAESLTSDCDFDQYNSSKIYQDATKKSIGSGRKPSGDKFMLTFNEKGFL